MNKKLIVIGTAIGAFMLGACEAATDVSSADVATVEKKAAPAVINKVLNVASIQEKFPMIKAEDIIESPVEGWFEIDAGDRVLYVSADGNYALSGDLIDLNTRVNLTEHRRNQARNALLASIDKKDMIVFSPTTGTEIKHSITVFTDIDCGYCRKLHREIDELNNLGIEVRYMFFPRSGPDTPSWEKAQAVWCSDDRRSALTRAKNGESLTPKTCDTGMIQTQWETGRKVGLRGTPAMVTEEGELIAGYLPAKSLLARLDQNKQ